MEDKGNAYMVLMGKPEATTRNTYAQREVKQTLRKGIE
jgi:hypothetical protein